MANPSIGTIICPMCGDLAEVRQDKNGKLYYSGDAGLITPRLAAGQKWIRDNMVENDVDHGDPKPAQFASDTELDDHEPAAKEKSWLDALREWGEDDE